MDHEPVFDEQLAAGQAWWDQVLDRIEDCDVFAPVISMRYRDSNPCGLEAKYAHGLNKAFLPVRIDAISPSVLPPFIAEAQWVNYDSSDRTSVFELVRAFRTVPPAAPPPDPMPERPPVPISYLLAFSEQIDSVDDLTRAQQTMLVSDLGARLDSADGPVVRSLLEKFAKRHDLVVSVANEVNRLLGTDTATPADPDETPHLPTQDEPATPSWEPPPPPPSATFGTNSGSQGGGKGGNKKTLITVLVIVGALVIAGLVAGIAVGLSSKDSKSSTPPVSFSPRTDGPAPTDATSSATAGLSVRPTTGLSDGDPVLVTGSGLDADTDYEITECANLSGDLRCDTDTRMTVTTDGNGTFSELYDVRGGTRSNE